MVNPKLQEMGDKLDVSPQDLGGIQKEKSKEKFIYPLIRAVIGTAIVVCSTILSTIIGGFVGKATSPPASSYPFAAVALASAAGTRAKKGKSFSVITIVTLLLSAVGFLAGYVAGHDNFGLAMLYNVYKR